MSSSHQQEERLRLIETRLNEFEVAQAVLVSSNKDLVEAIKALNESVLDLIKAAERYKGAQKALFVIWTVGAAIAGFTLQLFLSRKGN